MILTGECTSLDKDVWELGSRTQSAMNIGKMLVILGLSIAALGALVWLSDRFTGFKLFRLPGDIAVERDGFGFYLPITSMIIISVVLTGIFWLVRLFTR